MCEAVSLGARYRQFIEALDGVLEMAILAAYGHGLEPVAQDRRRRLMASLLSEPAIAAVSLALGTLENGERLVLVNGLHEFAAATSPMDAGPCTTRLEWAQVMLRILRDALRCGLPLPLLHGFANLEGLLELGQHDSHAWFYTIEAVSSQHQDATTPPAERVAGSRGNSG